MWYLHLKMAPGMVDCVTVIIHDAKKQVVHNPAQTAGPQACQFFSISFHYDTATCIIGSTSGFTRSSNCSEGEMRRQTKQLLPKYFITSLQGPGAGIMCKSLHHYFITQRAYLLPTQPGIFIM